MFDFFELILTLAVLGAVATFVIVFVSLVQQSRNRQEFSAALQRIEETQAAMQQLLREMADRPPAFAGRTADA
ncbi:hypothetical protein, partial [Methylogaea oryzae]